MTSPRAYVYSAFWSEEDETYIATCDAFPNLSWSASTRDEALHGIMQCVEDALIDMETSGEPQPTPTLTPHLIAEFCADRVPVQTLWNHALSTVQTSEDDDLAAQVVLLLSEHHRGHLTLDEVRTLLSAV